MRHQDLAALVVHLRPFRETSALVQFFTREQGRLSGVMKGLHRPRRPQNVQPFQLGRLSCSGRGNLMTVTQFETTRRFELTGDGLSAGFYVLELITRCLAERQAEVQIFDATLAVLDALAQNAALVPCLRRFEWELLSQLGYGYDFQHEAGTGEPIDAQAFYRLVHEQGFVRRATESGPAELPPAEASAGRASDANPGVMQQIPGWVLQAIAAQDYSRGEVARAARLINQAALAPLLGPAPLVSRSLYTGSTGDRDN